MKEKQTVCIATEETKKKGYNVPEGFVGKYGYFFTPEQLNEYTANVIRQALETAADKAEIEDIGGVGRDGEYHEHNIVDEKSITNTFEETFKKFEV